MSGSPDSTAVFHTSSLEAGVAIARAFVTHAMRLLLVVYSMIKIAVTPEVNAVSTLPMLLTLMLIVIASKAAPGLLRPD